MFTQQKLLFQFTKVIALVILFCFTFSYQAQGDEAVQEKAKDVAVITAQPEEYERLFEEYIEAKLDALEREFEKSKPRFDKMAELLGDNAVLATPQGERLQGKDSLERFWRKEKVSRTTKVEFPEVIRYIYDVADPIILDPEEDTIVHIGYAIIEYHVKTVNGGGTLRNKTGTLTLNARHPQRCTWR